MKVLPYSEKDEEDVMPNIDLFCSLFKKISSGSFLREFLMLSSENKSFLDSAASFWNFLCFLINIMAFLSDICVKCALDF